MTDAVLTHEPDAPGARIDERPELVACLTEVSTVGLIAGALAASGVLWLALFAVI